MTEKLKRYTKEIMDEKRQLPDRRSPGWHQELVQELDNHAERIEERLRRFFSRALGAFAVMGIMCAIALAGFAVVLDGQKTTTETIQQQRYDAFLQNCLDTNVRHDNVVSRIDKATARAKSKKDKQGAAVFKGILEAAVPYTSDCRRLARARVKGDQ